MDQRWNEPPAVCAAGGRLVEMEGVLRGKGLQHAYHSSDVCFIPGGQG